VRDRLSALPWVEIRSIKPDQPKLRVTFGVNDKTSVNEKDLREALGSRYGQGMKILSITNVEKTEDSSAKSSASKVQDSSATSSAAP
jgi:hypothetical protein